MRGDTSKETVGAVVKGLAAARENVERADELLGKEPQPWERENFIRNAEILAAKYGVTEQWAQLAAALMAEKNDEAMAKMAAFWTARRLYAPGDDGGMAQAAAELDVENAANLAALEAEEGFRPEQSVDTVAQAPEGPAPLGEVLDRTEAFIRDAYQNSYSTGERNLFKAHFALAQEEGHEKLPSLQYAHTVVMQDRTRRSGE